MLFRSLLISLIRYASPLLIAGCPRTVAISTHNSFRRRPALLGASNAVSIRGRYLQSCDGGGRIRSANTESSRSRMLRSRTSSPTSSFYVERISHRTLVKLDDAIFPKAIDSRNGRLSCPGRCCQCRIVEKLIIRQHNGEHRASHKRR